MDEPRPLTVAVCVPTIPPRRELLERALASVAAQTLVPDDVVVVEDEHGAGAGTARNAAWQLAETDVVAFLDDDDELLPDHLELCVAALVAERADVAYPWFELVGWPDATEERPDPLATKVGGELVHPLGVPFGTEQAKHLREHAWIPATIVVRRDVLERVGGYPTAGSEEYERFNRCEDWALLNRLLDARARFVHVPKRTWRLYHGQQSTAGQNWRQAS